MRTWSMRIVTYLIEYLGEFEFIFKTILNYKSGDQMVLLMQKIRHRTFKPSWYNVRWLSQSHIGVTNGYSDLCKSVCRF
jgi:hypothetical protein